MSNFNWESREMETNDSQMMIECYENIIKNIDWVLSNKQAPSEKTSKLLTMRWYLNNELHLKN